MSTTCRHILSITATVLVMFSLSAKALHAQSPSAENSAEILARLAALEAEVDNYRSGKFNAHPISYGDGTEDNFDCLGECDACEDDCRSQWYSGASMLFTKIHMKESFEVTVTNQGAGTMQLIPLQNDYEITPRIWLGYVNEDGLGIRASYWQYDHAGGSQTFVSDGVNIPGATATTVIFPATITTDTPGTTLRTNNSINFQTIDLEGTVDMEVSSTKIRAAGGLRYARIDQQMRAQTTTTIAPDGLLEWSREFEGVGLTLSADAERPILGGLSGVGVFRGSLLYGEKTLQRTVSGDVTPAPNTTPPTVALENADEVTTGFELALGLQWERQLTDCTSLRIRGTYEGQLWTAGGAPTLTFLGLEGFGLAGELNW